MLLTIAMLGAVAPAAQVEQHAIEQLLVDFDRVRIDPSEAAAKVRATGRLTIAARRATFDLDLVPHDLRAPHYRAQVTREGGVVEPLEPGPVHTYRGTVRGLEGAEARFTLDGESVSGLIVTDDEWFYVEPERGFSKAADPASLVVYSSADLRAPTLGFCGTSLAQMVGTPDHPPVVDAGKQGEIKPVVELATETDFEYVQVLGNPRKAIDEILSIMNKIDGAYEKQLGVNFSIVFQNAWDTRDDPFDSDDASDLLQQFRTYWNINNGSVERDLTHLWSAELFSSNTLGIAYVGVTCASAGYSYGLSQRIATGPGKFIVTAHEIGHNFNAFHPDQLNPPRSECDNTIMQSFVGTGFKFCEFSKAQIVTFLGTNSACLKNNHDPVAVAGLDRFAGSGATVTLVGGGSRDRNGDSLTYRWSQTGGPSAGLQGATTATASFVAPAVSEETRLTFRLAVEDGRGGRGEDTIVVTVVPGALPGVTVTSPATSAAVKAGKKLKIRWTPDAGLEGTLRIELSRDGGVTFEPLFSGVAARAGKAKWRRRRPRRRSFVLRASRTNGRRASRRSSRFNDSRG
jgi:hypothetical protein